MSDYLLQNILAQPEALRAVAKHQFGPGRHVLTASAQRLRGAKHVVLSGMGASLFACIPLSYLLGEHGVFASVIESSELLHFLSPTLTSDTVIVLVSRSGESVEITKLLPIVQQRGCSVVGVVNVPGSTLALQGSEAILVNSPSDHLVAVQTYSGTVATLALLAAACNDELATAEAELRRTADAMEHTLVECQRADWRDFAEMASPLYLLGRGAALASAQAGALLMHEVSKMPAVAMSSAQFRHGPVETVDREFRAIVFGSQQATAELDLALAADLTRIGGAIRWIGPARSGSNVASFAPWPADVPSRFASLLEIVPLQFLAHRTAQLRGIATDRFRFAPTVTLAETGFLDSSGPSGA